jgi:hypothetical protein
LTFGELIDEAIDQINAGTSAVNDSAMRLRVARAGQLAGDEGWILRPMPRRLTSGTISVLSTADGIGSMPADFGAAGPKFSLYIQGQRKRLEYMDSDQLLELREKNPDKTSLPDFYTFRGLAAGRLQVLLFMRNSVTITLVAENYQIKTPKLVDRPSRCVATVTGVAGLPNSASYVYQVTFVTADGETEGGEASAAVTTAALKKIQLTEIPTSPVSTVTSRKIYRNANASEQPKLVATIADNVTTTYLDNIADVALGANVPTTATAISGLEKFPEDYHRTALLRGTVAAIQNNEGDGRAPVQFPPDVIQRFMQMWMAEKIQHVVKRAPVYGARAFARFRG